MEENKTVILYDDTECPRDEAVYLINVKMWFPIDHDDIVETIDCDQVLLNDDIVYDHYHGGYNWHESCIYGWVSHNEEGWFSEDSDYCHGDRGDVYFMNSDVANDHAYYWCEDCDTYIEEGNHYDDCSTYGCNSRFTTFESSNYSPLYGHTFQKTNGMQYTFGVEIETSGQNINDFNQSLNVDCVTDGSINGGEYVTGVLHGDKGCVMLENIFNELNRCEAYISKACGIHVHIGGFNSNRRFSIVMIKLASLLQNEIFAMMPDSRQSNSYCKKIPGRFHSINLRNGLSKLADYVYDRDVFDRDKNAKMHMNKYSIPGRYYWMNLANCNNARGGNTVEFRCHGGSLNYEKVRRWMLVCMAMVKYAENNMRHILRSNELTLADVLLGTMKAKDAISLWHYCLTRANKFGGSLKQNATYTHEIAKMANNNRVSCFKDFYLKQNERV